MKKHKILSIAGSLNILMTKAIKWPLITCVFLMCQTPAIADEVELFEGAVGDEVFLNACGGNPQEYQSTPLNLHDKIVELPNTVLEITTSPYGRSIVVASSSKIFLSNGVTVTAKLENFRDLTISDSEGNNHISRRVTGATSLYEYRHEGKAIAWGVGWHKYCGEYYDFTDFTVLRTYVPIIDNSSQQQSKLVEANLSPAITDNLRALMSSPHPVFAESTTIMGAYGAVDCHYCGVRFFEFDNELYGIRELKLGSELANKKIPTEQVEPFKYLELLSRSDGIQESFELYKRYLSENSGLVQQSLDRLRANPQSLRTREGQPSKFDDFLLLVRSKNCSNLNVFKNTRELARVCFPEKACWIASCY